MIFNKIKELKAQGLKIGITFSTFDMLHAGHIAMLAESKNHCDYLICGIQTDPTIDRPESKNPPVQSIVERQIQLSAVRYVDETVVYQTEKDLEDILLETKRIMLPWIRLNRIIRDIPTDYIMASGDHPNMRQTLYNKMKKKGWKEGWVLSIDRLPLQIQKSRIEGSLS